MFARSGCHRNRCFTNVRITIPVDPAYRPYRDYIGSNLEVMDVLGGNRKILYQIPSSIQAPNWTRDGKSLIYNSSAGILYHYNLADGKIREIKKVALLPIIIMTMCYHSTAKQIGLSNHVGDKRISTIFVMPTSGESPNSDNTIRFTAFLFAYVDIGWQRTHLYRTT